MSRNEAKGKRKYRTNELVLNPDGTPKREGKVSHEMMDKSVKDYGIELRGGFLDESAFCYRPLKDVIEAHKNTVNVDHTLRPVIVCMAGANVQDPFKD
jgi:tRNA-splicing ligase RtcB